jgi:hypothetical protein
LVAVTATRIGVLDAHGAAFTRAGSRVPLPRALGRCLPRNVIGRRTRARGVDETTAGTGGLTGGSTVGATGVPLRRVICLRAIGWRRTIARRRRRAHILRVRPRHPGGRSQNPYSRDCYECAFHRLPPLNKCDGLGATDGNAGVKTDVPNDAGTFSLIARDGSSRAFVSQRESRVWHRKGDLLAPRELSGSATVQKFRWERSECAGRYWTSSTVSSLKSVQQPHGRRGRFDQHGCP